MHKATLLAVVVLIALSAPLSAVVGFCAKMPCCASHRSAATELSDGTAGCCSTIACVESAPTHLSNSPSVHNDGAVDVLHESFVAITPSVRAVATAAPICNNPSPPTAPQRLSILSTFLI